MDSQALITGGASIVAAGAALLSLRTSDARWLVLLVGLSSLLVPLATNPPPAISLAFWLVAVLLATYLLWIGVRDTSRLVASLPLGGSTEALFGALGFGLGVLVAPVAAPLRGPDSAVGAGCALALAALAMAGFGRDSLRAGIGTMLALDASVFVWIGFTGPVQGLLLAVLGIALVAVASATLAYTRLAYHLRGELELTPRAHDLRDLP